MTYYKHEIGPYNLHVIPTNQFKTIEIQINFKRIITKEEITARNLLTYVLTSGTKKYPTKRALELVTEELYGLACGTSSSLSGKYGVLSFNASFLNERYSEPGMLEASFDFLFDLLFDPNVVDHAFNKETFAIAKNALKEIIETENDNPGSYSRNRLLEEMEKGPFSYRSNGYLEDLEKLDESSLYQAYETMLKSDLVDIFVVGEVDVTQIKQLIRSKFLVNTIKKKGENHILNTQKARGRIKTIKEKKPFNQSKLQIGCRFDGLSEFERKYVLSVYNFILGGSPDSKLFTTVREKNSLCYYISGSVSQVKNLIIIRSGINRTDFKKAIALIKKEMKNMQLGKITEEEIEKAKITYISSCKELSDNPSDLLSTYIVKEYLDTDEIDVRMEQIKKVTKEMVIALSKKVQLDTVYFLEGSGEDEEDSAQ